MSTTLVLHVYTWCISLPPKITILSSEAVYSDEISMPLLMMYVYTYWRQHCDQYEWKGKHHLQAGCFEQSMCWIECHIQVLAVLEQGRDHCLDLRWHHQWRQSCHCYVKHHDQYMLLRKVTKISHPMSGSTRIGMIGCAQLLCGKSNLHIKEYVYMHTW